jgi:purine-nucleoside phosphorylase
MTDLSLAAQAVLNAAFTLADNLDREVTETEMIAAALRAAALYCKRDALQLLSIADELEKQAYAL